MFHVPIILSRSQKGKEAAPADTRGVVIAGSLQRSATSPQTGGPRGHGTNEKSHEPSAPVRPAGPRCVPRTAGVRALHQVEHCHAAG